MLASASTMWVQFAFAQNPQWDRIIDGIREYTELSRMELILRVISEYQTNNPDKFDLSGLSIDQIVEKIYEWYVNLNEPRPEITKELLFDKYQEIIETPPPEPGPISQSTIDELFN